jgi:DNA-binding PadR family transcriptional regulator
MTMPMTAALRKILVVFAEKPGARLCGDDIALDSGIARTTVIPLLWRLESKGWLEGQWETGPRRRYYRLTPAGASGAYQALREHIHPFPLTESDDYAHLLDFLADHAITEEQLLAGIAERRTAQDTHTG